MFNRIYFIRNGGDLDQEVNNPVQVGQDIPVFFNAKNFSRTALRSYLLPTRENIITCRSAGESLPLIPYNYELDRPIRFSNDIRVAFLQYQSLLEKSRELALAEFDEQRLSYQQQLKQYEQEQQALIEEDVAELIAKRTIPVSKSINQMADDVSQQVIARAFPQVATQIRYLNDDEPNLDIVRYLEEGFATRDISQEGLIDPNSHIWQQFLDVYEDAKMVEGVQYAKDLTGDDLDEILEDYGNDFYDLQQSADHKNDSRQYSLQVPPQWASRDVKGAALWIQRQQLLSSGELPELIPFDHKVDNLADLNDLDATQQDEMLTQASLLAASATSNHLDYIKDSTIIESLKPYIQYEQNALNMIQMAQNIILKNIYDRQSKIMLKLRAYKPSLEREVELLREFDKDALGRFDRMHETHRHLLHSLAHGEINRHELLTQVRDNINREYHAWVMSYNPDDKYNRERTQTFFEQKFATEAQMAHGAGEKLKTEIIGVIGRDQNTQRARDVYIEHTQDQRQDLLTAINTTLIKLKQELIDVVDDEFIKLNLFLGEVSTADKELDLYVDKIQGLKLEWDRYSLLTKAAVIKALIVQRDDMEEADEILDSANKAIFNMEYLKKVIHVIGNDLTDVVDVAGKRIHNQYCHFDPTLNPYQMPKDPQTGNILGLTYPMPEPYILSPNIIIPQQHQHFELGHEGDGFGLTAGTQYSEQDWKNQQMTLQDRIQAAIGANPESALHTVNSSYGVLPEDFELFETTPFEDKVPERIADSGMGEWEKAFKEYISDVGIASVDNAEASCVGLSASTLADVVNSGEIDIKDFNLSEFGQKWGITKLILTGFEQVMNEINGNNHEYNNTHEIDANSVILRQKLKEMIINEYHTHLLAIPEKDLGMLQLYLQHQLHNNPTKTSTTQQQLISNEEKNIPFYYQFYEKCTSFLSSLFIMRSKPSQKQDLRTPQELIRYSVARQKQQNEQRRAEIIHEMAQKDLLVKLKADMYTTGCDI